MQGFSAKSQIYLRFLLKRLVIRRSDLCATVNSGECVAGGVRNYYKYFAIIVPIGLRRYYKYLFAFF